MENHAYTPLKYTVNIDIFLSIHLHIFVQMGNSAPIKMF